MAVIEATQRNRVEKDLFFSGWFTLPESNITGEFFVVGRLSGFLLGPSAYFQVLTVGFREGIFGIMPCVTRTFRSPGTSHPRRVRLSTYKGLHMINTYTTSTSSSSSSTTTTTATATATATYRIHGTDIFTYIDGWLLLVQCR